MKFGQTLEQSKIAKWSDHYVNFNQVKKSLKLCYENGLDEQKLHSWYHDIEGELDKVSAHHENFIRQVEQNFKDLREYAELNAARTDSTVSSFDVTGYIDKRLAEIFEDTDDLENFSRTNDTAFRKLLKKHDKKTGLSKSSWLQEEGWRSFMNEKVFQDLRVRINTLSEQYGSERAKDHLQDRAAQERSKVTIAGFFCFILGAIFVALIDVAILAELKPTNPMYNTDHFLGVFPIFRFFFHLVVLVWVTGAVVMVFEYYGVNYIFILGIHAKSKMRAHHFFALASLQSLIWVVIFLVYVCDYKFNLGESESRSRWNIYPIVLIVAELATLFLPSHTFRTKYRMHLLSCLVSVFIAPCVPVTFGANVLGDVLTSFSRPLNDVEYMFCYFLSGDWNLHPLGVPSCQTPNPIITPLLLMSPYWLRFLQCSRRIYDTQKEFPILWQNPNLWNAIKYLTGLAVPVVSSIWPGLTPQVLTASLIATTYMIVWDTKMDWGCNFLGQSPQRMRLYPSWFYTYIFFTNAAFRFGWVLTLLPVMWLGCDWGDDSATCDILPSKDFIIFIASLIEIIRRGQWSLLRCEHEHLTNNSRYRALCWVPPLVIENQPRLQRRGTLSEYGSPRSKKLSPTTENSSVASGRPSEARGLGAPLLPNDQLNRLTLAREPASFSGPPPLLASETHNGSTASGFSGPAYEKVPANNIEENKGSGYVSVSSQMWPKIATSQSAEVQKDGNKWSIITISDCKASPPKLLNRT